MESVNGKLVQLRRSQRAASQVIDIYKYLPIQLTIYIRIQMPNLWR